MSQSDRVAVLNPVGTDEGCSDWAALKRLRSDPDAVCVLYDRYVARLVARLLAIRVEPDVAFEIVQETFARTLERGHRVRIPPDGSAWPWLWSVARNLAADHRRRGVVDAAARKRLQIEAPGFHPDEMDALIERFGSSEASGWLGSALDGLPPSQREAVIGRVVDGKDYPELARRAAVSEELVRARVSRGLRALRLRLGGEKA